jgi:hypothetical protein
LAELPRYTNAFIETSLPTVMLLYLSHTAGADIALHCPLSILYFVFITPAPASCPALSGGTAVSIGRRGDTAVTASRRAA